MQTLGDPFIYMDWSCRRKVKCYCSEEKKDKKKKKNSEKLKEEMKKKKGKWVLKPNPIEEYS